MADFSSDGRTGFTGLKAADKVSGGLYDGCGIEAINPRERVTHFTDFLNTADLTEWTSTNIGTLTETGFEILGINENGFNGNGHARLRADAADQEGVSIVWANSGATVVGALTFALGQPTTFVASISQTDWDAQHWYVGFMAYSGGGVAMGSTTGDMSPACYAGFHYNDDDDTGGVPNLIYLVTGGAETAVTPTDRVGNTLTFAAPTDVGSTGAGFREFGIRIIPSTLIVSTAISAGRIEWYLDKALVGSTTFSGTYSALVPAICLLNNEATADSLVIDYAVKSYPRAL
jgi:hypothetical protein